MKTPPADLAKRLLDVSERVLHGDPPPRLEDVAALVGASRATMYYYFAGRDDLLTFLLTAHAQGGASAVREALDPIAGDPPEQRLRAMVAALARYLAERPGICAGLLGALGATGRMNEVLQANDLWIAGPLRQLLTECRTAGKVTAHNVDDAANAIMGALLLTVLGRGPGRADARRFPDHLTDQILHGILKR